MDSNNNPTTPRPGSESLNERLRRAAEMARRNMVSENAPASQPSYQQPQPQPRPQPQPQQPRQPRPEPRQYPEPQTPRQPEQPQQRSYEPEPHTPRQQAGAVPPQMPPRDYPPRRPQGRQPVPQAEEQKKSKKTMLIIVILAVLLGLAILAVVLLSAKNSSEMEAQQQQIEQLQLQNEQIQLANEYESLNNEFAQYENQTSLLANDSIVQKYAAARAQVEKLLDELKNEKSKSAAQIAKLKGEIETLKAILRTYVEQINELQKENQTLRSENEEVKAQNSQLTQTVQSVQATNQHLSERMTLAEKLNVTGVNLIPLNKKGKKEKNVTKARQLEVTFTIPQNNSTPVGEKTIYLRITSPEGELLGNAGSFSFEGASLQATARKTIEYQGEEIGGIKIYWDVNATLNPGDYTVELFADNYRLASRRFTLKK